MNCNWRCREHSSMGPCGKKTRPCGLRGNPKKSTWWPVLPPCRMWWPNLKSSPKPMLMCSLPASQAWAKRWPPNGSTSILHEKMVVSWPSTARLCRVLCWKANSSATRREPSRARRNAALGVLSWLMVAPCCWMKSVNLIWHCNLNCSGFFKSERLSVSGQAVRFEPTFG